MAFKNVFSDFISGFGSKNTQAANAVSSIYDSMADRNVYGNNYMYSDRVGGSGVGNTLNSVGDAAMQFNPKIGAPIKAAAAYADVIGFLGRRPEDITEYYGQREMPTYNLGEKVGNVSSLEPGRAFWGNFKKTGDPITSFMARSKARKNKAQLEQDIRDSQSNYSSALLGYREAEQFQNVIDSRRMDLMNRFMGIPNL